MAVPRRTSQRVTLVMLVLASATFITLDYRGEAKHTVASVRNVARDVLAPAQRLIAAILHPVGDLFSGAVNYGDAQAENVQLQRQIGALERRIEEQGVVEQQYRQLLQLEHLPFAENIPTVTAQIISSPPSNFNLEIEIDKGSSSGVGPNMPVVAGPGLAGTVISVTSSTAIVELITDPRAQVGVRFGNNELAVVNGAGPAENLGLTRLVSGEPVTTSEIVYTSGLLPAAYPADIPVGTVSSVTQVPGAFTTNVTVKPYVNFNTLQYVDVMLWIPPV